MENGFEKQQREDHDMLIRIDTRMQSMQKTLEDMSKNTGENLARMDERKVNKEDMNKWLTELKLDIDKSFANFSSEITDHEKRIRRIEKWGFMAMGALWLLELILKLSGH